MLGRVANTIYWMNRHLERAENYGFMDVNFNLSLELPPNEIQQWQPLIIQAIGNCISHLIESRKIKSSIF
jgi:uncharacterized alpha-E superfamily protein